ncbi:MAG UNVERIFIED_CONTAM: hypothetical protein LVR29_16125 [Microcystis novacekii LVE1205-3]|jgi:ribosomal protein S12 methylthiotransferase accessory factor
MFNQLDWNPAYSIETLEPNTVFFLSERESICFQEPLYYRLVRLIDGQRNLDEIIDILQLEFSQKSRELIRIILTFLQLLLIIVWQFKKQFFSYINKGFLLEKKNYCRLI